MTDAFREYALAHSGVRGQKWGRRRYEDYEGHLTEEGKRHYLDKYDSLKEKTRKTTAAIQKTKAKLKTNSAKEAKYSYKEKKHASKMPKHEWSKKLINKRYHTWRNEKNGLKAALYKQKAMRGEKKLQRLINKLKKQNGKLLSTKDILVLNKLLVEHSGLSNTPFSALLQEYEHMSDDQKEFVCTLIDDAFPEVGEEKLDIYSDSDFDDNENESENENKSKVENETKNRNDSEKINTNVNEHADNTATVGATLTV